MKHRVLIAALAVLTSGTILQTGIAAELTYRATATAKIINDDEESAYNIAQRKSRQAAVIQALEKITAAPSLDETVTEKLKSIVDQISEDQFEETTRRIKDSVEVATTVRLDENQFRQFLREKGIAGSAGAAGLSKILMIIEQYNTTPTELNLPLEEIREYSSKKGSSFSNKSVNAKSAVSAGDSKSTFDQSVDARASQASSIKGSESASYNADARIAGQRGSMSASESGAASRSAQASQASSASLKSNTSASASDANFSKSSAVQKTNIQSESHDDVSFKEVIKYQPKSNKPATNRVVETEFTKMLLSYGIETKSNELFRDRYFKAKPLTYDEMREGKGISKYVYAARDDKEIDADYFMAGTATVIDLGPDPRQPAQKQCSGILDVRAYSTSTSTNLAAGGARELGVGRSIDECAGNVGAKLAKVAGEVISAAILENFQEKQRSGEQFDLIIVGTNIPFEIEDALIEIFKDLGIKDAKQKESNQKRIEYSLKYKGGQALATAVASALKRKASAVSSGLDRLAEGSRQYVCLGQCSALVKASK